MTIYKNLDKAKGQRIKVKAGGKYRRGIVINTGIRKTDNVQMVRVRIDYQEIPWGASFPAVRWYPIDLVRKADKINWL